MTKTVKEFLLDQASGDVSIEYSDNSTSSYNLANAVTATESVDGVVNIVAGGLSPFGGISDGIPPRRCDVLIYGATPPSIEAAFQAAARGASVVIIEPTNHIGGMMTSGIAKTDMRANASPRAACNGLTAEVLRRSAIEVGQDNFSASYMDQWNYPCQVFDKIFRSMISERKIQVYTGWRVKEIGGVVVTNGQMMKWELEKSNNPSVTTTAQAREYLSGYTQPDIGRLAGLTYTAGRESSATYAEANAGTTAANLTFTGIDPYIIPGDSGSGLLPGINNSPLPAAGSADSNGMWDCYRLVVTNDPAQQISFPEPVNYDLLRYELLGRWFAQGAGPQTLSAAITRYDIREDAYPAGIASGKLIENWNNTNISFNRPGGYPGYWNATYAQREIMDQDLRDYTLGLIKFLKTDSRVPSAIKTELSMWGLLKGEPYGADGLPPLPYRREGGRLTTARYVVNQNDLSGTRVSPDPIAFGSYNSDIHFCGAWLDGGVIKIEGLTTYSPPNRYRIDRGVVLPHQQ